MNPFEKLFGVLLAALCLLTAPSAHAKGGGSASIQYFLLGYPADAIILARFDDEEKNLIVEKVYQGKLHPDDKIALSDQDRAVFDISQKEPEHNSSQNFLLFLVSKGVDHSFRYSTPVGSDWMADTSASRRIVDGKVYNWALGIPRGVVLLPKPGPNEKTDGLFVDKSTGTLDRAEALIRYGNQLHEQWATAKASTDSKQKLELLSTFLLPTDDGMFTPYMAWSMAPESLDEADKTGAASIPFLVGLLKLPSFQEDFAPDGWIGFGAQQRVKVEQRLHLQKARLETNPAKKLAELAPLFVLPEIEFRGGCDGNCLLTEIMDKALAAVEEVGPLAIPFLQEVLMRPYYQATERLESGLLNSGGQERRQKVEAALAQLQAKTGASAQRQNGG
jgi:hypothetical protein